MKFFFENHLSKKSNLLIKNLNIQYNKNNYLENILNNNFQIISIFSKQLVVKSSKYKLLLNLYKFFNFFFNYINSKNNYKNYLYYFEIYSAINNNIYLNNPIFLFSWYLNYFFFLFQIKKKNNSKKTKKLNSNEYSLNFLNKSKRKIYFFKLLKSILLLNKNKTFNNSFFDILLDSFLNLKNSTIYKNKILLYKKFISS